MYVARGLLAAIVAALGAFRRAAVPGDMEASIDRDLRRSSQTIAVDYTSEGLEDFGDASGSEQTTASRR